MFLMIIFVER